MCTIPQAEDLRFLVDPLQRAVRRRSRLLVTMCMAEPLHMEIETLALLVEGSPAAAACEVVHENLRELIADGYAEPGVDGPAVLNSAGFSLAVSHAHVQMLHEAHSLRRVEQFLLRIDAAVATINWLVGGDCYTLNVNGSQAGYGQHDAERLLLAAGLSPAARYVQDQRTSVVYEMAATL